MCSAKRLSEKERKTEIMNSAMEVISKKGLGNTTMEDIIAGTTLSKGGVYHYYGNVIEIFKDIMVLGIEYRIEIIKEHLDDCKKGYEKEFMVKEIVDKTLDDNPYMPLYVEFLINKKRNPELNHLMIELQEQTKERFKMVMNDTPGWIFNKEVFQLLTDFINAIIVASDVLEARENFIRNRQIIEKMFVLIMEEDKGGSDPDESL